MLATWWKLTRKWSVQRLVERSKRGEKFYRVPCSSGLIEGAAALMVMGVVLISRACLGLDGVSQECMALWVLKGREHGSPTLPRPVVTWLPSPEAPVATWHLVGKWSAFFETVSWLKRASLNKALLMCGFWVLLAFHVLNMKLITRREGDRYEGWKSKRRWWDPERDSVSRSGLD